MKYGIISDIHEDIINLKLALRKIEKLGCDEIVCLGDISGYSARNHYFHDQRNASECLKVVRDNCSIIVAGNHDLHAAKRLPGVKGDFDYPEDWYARDFKTRKKLSSDKVWLYDDDELDPLYTGEERKYLEKIPEYFVLNHEDHKVLFSHFIHPNLTGSSRVFYSLNEEFDDHKNFMKEKGCTYAFAGHRHFLGLFVSSREKIIRKGFNRKHILTEHDCVLVPSIVRNKFHNGFCIFDNQSETVIAKRI